MKDQSKPDNKLLIVYNEDSGLFNAFSSSLHKALAPETYACQLCCLTYGLTHMVGEWKAYLQTLPFPVQALHRNEFRVNYPSLKLLDLPVILFERDGLVEVVLTASEINLKTDITQLLKLLDQFILSGVLSPNTDV
jgi:hypothetical protein